MNLRATDPRDQAVFHTLPLVMAPRYGEMAPLAGGSKRLIAGNDGLYLEVRSPALHARVRVEHVAVPLPYGPVESFLRLAAGPVPERLITEAIDRAVAACPNETALAIVVNEAGDGYCIQDVAIDASSPVAVRYADDIDDDRLVFDIHSHGHASARFSHVDDASDRMRRGPYIALVFGTCVAREVTTTSARLCCSPYLIHIPPMALPGRDLVARESAP